MTTCPICGRKVSHLGPESWIMTDQGIAHLDCVIPPKKCKRCPHCVEQCAEFEEDKTKT